jgi:hypothetical protein
MLEFTDSNGVTWRVWNTVPSTRATLSGEYEKGWLTFESPLSRRRLAPVPTEWEVAPPDRLELMCRAASDVLTRIRATSADESLSDDQPEAG